IESTKELQRITREMDQQFTAFKTNIVVELIPTIEALAQKINSPAFREGFGAIVEGAANAAIKVAGLAAEIANLARFAGEEVAAQMFGPALDDVVRLEQKVTELQDKLAKAEKPVLFDFAPDGYAEGIRAELDAATAALEQARAAQEAYAARASGASADIGELDRRTQAGTASLRDYRGEQEAATAAQKKAEEARKRAIESAKQHEQRLKAEAGALGQLEAILLQY